MFTHSRRVEVGVRRNVYQLKPSQFCKKR